MSFSVAKLPPGGLTQVEFLFASLIKLFKLTCLKAVSLSLAMLVKGITPIVGIERAAFREVSRR